MAMKTGRPNLLQRMAARYLDKSLGGSIEQQWLRQHLSDDGGSASSPAPSVSRDRAGVGYGGHSWTYVAIHKIVTKGSCCPYVIKRRGEHVEKHPLLDLLQRPNPVQNDVRLYALTMLSLELWGKAYWAIERKGRTPVELWGIPAAMVKPGKTKRAIPLEYLVRDTQGREVPYPAEDIVAFRFDGPATTLDSTAPMAPAQQAIQADVSAMRAQVAWFEHGANPTLAISLPGSMSDDQRVRMKSEFTSVYAGIANWFRPVVLDGGATAAPLNTGPTSTWTELRQQWRQEILAVFGVPPALAGIFDNAQYGVSIREQRQMMWTDTLQPRLEAMAADIDMQLMPQLDKEGSYAWDYAKVSELRPDYAALATAANMMLAAGTHSVDEVRQEVYGIEPIGGDWGTARWGTFNQVVIATANGNAAGYSSPPEPTDTEPTSEPEKAVGATKAQKATPARRKALRRLDSVARVALWKANNAARDAEIRRLMPILGKWYDELAADVIRRIETNKGHLGSRVKAPSIDMLLFLLDWGTKELQGAMAPALEEMVERSGQTAMDLLQVGMTFSIENPRIRELLVARTLQMKTVAQTAQDACRRSLQDGLAAGENVDDLIRRVREWSSTGKRYHAEAVARTETTVCSNAANLEGYTQAGAAGTEWLSIVDDRSRPEHAPMDGTVVAIGEKYTVGGVECYGPGDDALGPDGIINCRCSLAPVVESEMPEGEE